MWMQTSSMCMYILAMSMYINVYQISWQTATETATANCLTDLHQVELSSPTTILSLHQHLGNLNLCDFVALLPLPVNWVGYAAAVNSWPARNL